MAGYDADWENRQGEWSGRRAFGAGRPPGGRGQGEQPWASRPPRGWARGSRANRYGDEFAGWGPTYGADYGRRPQGFGRAYDFGYPGGEWGDPGNARGFGTRGSDATPESRIGRGRARAWSSDWRTSAYNAAYGRDYQYPGRRGTVPWSYRRGRSGYSAEFGDVGAGRGESRRSPNGSGYEQGQLGKAPGNMGAGDFARRADRHYGRTPVDRWPEPVASRVKRHMGDDDVRESVRENLFQDSYVNPDRIDVQVDRGVVTLRGEVEDFLQARYAWDDAWESPGVRGVINNLTVRTDRASDEMDMPQTRHPLGRE